MGNFKLFIDFYFENIREFMELLQSICCEKGNSLTYHVIF